MRSKRNWADPPGVCGHPLARHLHNPRRRLTAALLLAGSTHAAAIGLLGFAVDSAPPPLSPQVTWLVQPGLAPPEPTPRTAAADQRAGHGDSTRHRRGGRNSVPSGSAMAVVGHAETPAARGSATTATAIARPRIAATEPVTIALGERGDAVHPGLAARRAAHAHYLARWRAAVERAGTQHFPAAAIAAASASTLTLAVTLRADGTIETARVVHSSGSPALDRAALAILHRAAPFPPLPQSLAATSPLLSFAYEWRFLGPDTAGGPGKR